MAMQSVQGLSSAWQATQVIHQVPRNLVSEITSKLAGDVKVVSLVAPAGYGKTNLLHQCQHLLHGQKVDFRYVKLEPEHNKRAGFTAMLQSTSCSLKMRHQDLEKTSSRESFIGFKKMLVNALSRREEKLVIVLDGLENIRSREITDFINSLICFSSSRVQFVLASRNAMPLPLSELRMQGRLYEPSLEQIALSQKEIQSLSQLVLSEGLSTKQCVALQTKTRGWAAGVVVALQAIAAGTNKDLSLSEFSGCDQALVSYFRETLFSQLEENTKLLLLATATEESVADDYIQANYSIEGGGEFIEGASGFIETVANLGLFVCELKRDRSAFHYHPLFRDYLRYELAKTYGGKLPLKSEPAIEKTERINPGHQVIYANFDAKKDSMMVEPLTARELQLLELISCGDTNREIAEKVFISEQTVKWHLNKVYAKMGVKNRTTAVAKARSYQVI